MAIYNTGQPIDIKLNTGIDLSSGTSPKIRWKNPSGSTGYWDAAVIQGNKIRYKTSASDIAAGQEGNWEFRASIVLDGVPHLGEPVIRKFVTP